jgi:protein-S-isoprenylcysteine O-methyltransferase Ste14
VLKLLYATVAYASFLLIAVWSVAFLGGFAIPKTIDSGDAGPWPIALAIDGAILGLFAVQHSVMARPGFKRVWTKVVPPAIERATYVLLSSLILGLLYSAWRPMPGVLWSVTGAAAIALWIAYGLGWVIVVASTFMIDHFHLFGLTQAWQALKKKAETEPSFRVVLLYRFVRHPLMLGFLIAFWATPHMSVGHLVFTLLATGYIFVGTYFEERDLRAALGETYARYQAEVPMLLPIPKRKS